jgi:hypothetical protein
VVLSLDDSVGGRALSWNVQFNLLEMLVCMTLKIKDESVNLAISRSSQDGHCEQINVS